MEITFEQLPQTIGEIFDKVSSIENLLKSFDSKKASNQDIWMDMNALVQYDPMKRSKLTFYGLVSKGKIPVHRSGKKLQFLRSEIDAWLKTGNIPDDRPAESDSNVN
jgi:excisionase family DNA binding protein